MAVIADLGYIVIPIIASICIAAICYVISSFLYRIIGAPLKLIRARNALSIVSALAIISALALPRQGSTPLSLLQFGGYLLVGAVVFWLAIVWAHRTRRGALG